MGTPITTETKPLYITVSIGITVTGLESVDLNTLLKQVDEALYKAKDNGRNRVEMFRQPA
jgi:diguanylate cyclase (GGDEF)-like protein